MSKTPAVRAVSFKRSTSISSFVTSPASLLDRSRPPLLYKESICGKDDIPPLYKVTWTKKDRQDAETFASNPRFASLGLPATQPDISTVERDTSGKRGKFLLYSNDTLQSSPMGAPTRRTTANAALVLEPGV